MMMRLLLHHQPPLSRSFCLAGGAAARGLSHLIPSPWLPTLLLTHFVSSSPFPSKSFTLQHTPPPGTSLQHSHPSKRTHQLTWASSSSPPQSFHSGAVAHQPGEHRAPGSSMLSVTIQCSGDIADELVEALMCFGASSVSIEDANLGGPHEELIYSSGPVPWDTGKQHFWKKSQLTILFPPGQEVGECLAFAFHSIGLKEMLPYEVKEAEHRNWLQQVKDMFQPLEVADGLWIVPKWRTPPDALAMNVILDPGLAFGTGEHPTTRLCLQWLNHAVKGGERILDYGTGSGILAVAALKMGAAKAIGVDIDPMALSSATHNAELNGFGSESLQVVITSVNEDDPVPFGVVEFDIIVANILVNPLLELSVRIASYAKPGGLVGLSGMLTCQVEQVKERYSCYLENVQVIEDDDWAFLSGTKKHPNL